MFAAMIRKLHVLFACLFLNVIVMADDNTTSITIVRGYEGMSRYADAASYADPEAYGALFKRHVFQRYERQCAGLGPERDTSRTWLRTPINDIDALKLSLEKIENSDADQRAREAAERAAGVLPRGPLTICIFAYPPDIQSASFVTDVMGGAMGFADARGSLWLQLLPIDGWLDEIYPAVTHEYYHAVNYPEDGAALTLLDVLVSEGGADSFTAVLYADFVPQWANALTATEQAEVWSKMKPVLDTIDPATIDRYVFGNGSTVPRQAGYTIGFEIVQAWLMRNPDIAPAEWSLLSPQSILEGSGYNPE